MSIWGDLCRSGIPADDTNAICRSEVNRCRFAMRKGVPAAHRGGATRHHRRSPGRRWVEERLQNKRGTAWSIFARYQRTGEVVWGREAALSTIGWTTRARTCRWYVWRTMPSWRWNIWPSSCSSQSAGGAGGDVATLGGWRRRMLLDGISIAIQSVTGDQVDAQYRHSNLPECSTKSDICQDIWQVLCYQSFFVLSLFWRVATLMSCRPFYQMLYNIGVVHAE